MCVIVSPQHARLRRTPSISDLPLAHLPAGGSFARTRMTRPSGWATFPWGSALPGHWQLCVDNLTKPGYTYDPAFNDVPECASWDN